MVALGGVRDGWLLTLILHIEKCGVYVWLQLTEKRKTTTIKIVTAESMGFAIGETQLGAPAKYPFADLDIGQGFVMEAGHTAEASARAAYWQRKLGRKFSARRVEGGVFVFRVK